MAHSIAVSVLLASAPVNAPCPWAISPAHAEALVQELEPNEPPCHLIDVRTEKVQTLLRWRADDGTEVTSTVLPSACAPESATAGPHFATVIPAELARLCPEDSERLVQAVTGAALEAPLDLSEDPPAPPASPSQDHGDTFSIFPLTWPMRVVILALVLVVGVLLWTRRRRRAAEETTPPETE